MTKRMTPVDDRLYDYILAHSLRDMDVLRRLREQTDTLGAISRMQIAPEQGQFMALQAQLMNARRYLEVGTFTGYSALVIALALPADGEVVACDVNEEWTSIARRYWQEAGVAHKIDLRLAPAADTLQKLLDAGQADSFDLMFIDADKRNYDTYYELGLRLVRPGGLIMFDNVLWGGDVANPADHEKDTQALRDLNDKLHRDGRVVISMLAIGDGLTLALKNSRL